MADRKIRDPDSDQSGTDEFLRGILDRLRFNTFVEGTYPSGQMQGSGSEESIFFLDEFESGITQDIGSGPNPGYVDVRSLSSFYLRVSPDTAGGGESVDVNVYGRRVEDANDENFISGQTVASADGITDVAFKYDIDEYSWIRVTGNSSASDHAFWMMATGDDLPVLGDQGDTSQQDPSQSASLIALTKGLQELLRGPLSNKNPGDDEEIRTLVPEVQDTGSVTISDTYNSDDVTDIELARREPFSTVIVSAFNQDTQDDKSLDVRLREGPVTISEIPGSMSESDLFHQLDETTNISEGSNYQKKFDVTGRSIQLQFRTNGSGSGGTVDYAIVCV